MELLEQFYNERIKDADSREFSDLSEAEKKGLSNTFAFAGYQLGKAAEPMAILVKSVINRIINKVFVGLTKGD